MSLIRCEDGRCSFCGQGHDLVGSSMASTKICAPCLRLCVGILAEDAGIELDDETQLTHAEVDAILDTFAKAPRQPPRDNDYRCSFCDRSCADAKKLIAGPRVFICDACVVGAIAVCRG